MKDKINMGMNIPAVKGHCKIELFEDGKKVKEIEQDNYVHPKYLGALNKIYSYRAFQFDTNSSGNLLSDNTIGTRGGEERVPFRGLILTDAVHAEDPENERSIKGNIIGLNGLNENNTQQSVFKGRYHRGESEHSLEYHKFVYEFREEEANGVIGSIYTVPGLPSGSFTSRVDKPNIYTRTVSGVPSDYGLAFIDDTFVYFVYRHSRGTFSMTEAYDPNIYRARKEEISKLGSPVEAESIHMPVRPIRGMTEKDGRIYMWGHLRHSRDADISDVPPGHSFIISAPKNDISNVRVEKIWNLDELNSIFGVTVSTSTSYLRDQNYIMASQGDLMYDPENDTFTMLFRDVETTDKRQVPDKALYVFDSDFNLVESKWDPFETYSASFYDPQTVLVDDKIIDMTADEIKDGDPRIRLDIGNTTSYYSLKKYNDFFDIRGDRYSLRFTPAAHFFSRVLLTQPINKTNQQTMKITYEFTREPLSFEHIDDGSKYTPTTPTELHIHPVTVITPEEESTPQTTPEHQYLLDALPEHTSSTNTNVIVTIRDGDEWAMYHSADPLVSETADVGNRMIPGGTWDYYTWTGSRWKLGGSASTDLVRHGYIIYTSVDIVEDGTNNVLVEAGGNTVP